MKRTFLSAITALIILTLTGCGGDGNSSSPPQFVVTQILSDPLFDGDIARDPATGFLTITQGFTESVFAGIDPATGVEYRAFLDFPLTGAGGVPGNAVIESAFLDIVIDSVQTLTGTGTVPIRIDLVDFQPPELIETDFFPVDQPALASITTAIFQSDVRRHVTLDVTSLMTEAQRLVLPDFQIRILGLVSPGLIEINDTTSGLRGDLAPLLEVTYF